MKAAIGAHRDIDLLQTAVNHLAAIAGIAVRDVLMTPCGIDLVNEQILSDPAMASAKVACIALSMSPRWPRPCHCAKLDWISAHCANAILRV